MGLLKRKLPETSPVAETHGRAEEPTGQSLPISAKSSGTIIPAPQRERIMLRHASGESIRKIARAENRARETVTKIVNSDDMRDHVVGLREQFYGLGNAAIAAVKHALVDEKDAQIAYRLLENIGVVPSLLERELIQANQEVIKKEDLNEFESALVGDAEGLQAQILIGTARMMQERAKFYNLELPTPQKLRRNHAIQALIDEFSVGQDGKPNQLSSAGRERMQKDIEGYIQRLAAGDDVNPTRPEQLRLKDDAFQENVEKPAECLGSQTSAHGRENDGKKYISRLRLTLKPSS